MLFDKSKHFAGDIGGGADVVRIQIPGAQIFHTCIIGSQDADSDLCRSAQVRTVEGNRRDWPSPHSLSGFLAQALEKPIFRHIALSATAAFTIGLADPRGCRELSPLRKPLPALPEASYAGRPADHSIPPSTQVDSRRAGWQLSTSDRAAGYRESS